MFLGIDVGTSEVKALLLDSRHRVVGTAGSPLVISRPQVGHSEQDPAHWWAATLKATAQLRHSFPDLYGAVSAVGLSGQMHGAVLLDRRNSVLRPAILWNDTRAAQECVDLMAQLPSLPALAGSLAMPGFTAPKLRWVAQHEPAIFDQIDKVLLPKDYLRLLMTGEFISDMSDASGTLWLDVARRDWSPELLRLTGVNRGHMPRLVEGAALGGVLTAHAAHLLGLRPGTVVAGGAGDNAASAIGMGVVNAGQGFLSLGTSGVGFVVTPHYQPNAASATHAFCHAIPGRWHQMSVMLSAASCLQWVTHLVGAASESALAQQAEGLSTLQREQAPLFLPYLSGERTPHNDAKTRGSFHGLSFDTDVASLAYAVMEGVSFGLTDGLHALKAAGSTVKQMSLVGGGARSALWGQQLATLLDVPVLIHADSASGGALGAARLAWLAFKGAADGDADELAADLAAICPAPAVTHTYVPEASAKEALWTRYERFKALYPALKSVP